MHVSRGCCDKRPPTGGLHSTDLLPLISGGQKSKMGLAGLKTRCWQGCVPLGGSGRESVSWPFPASRGHSLSVAHGPASVCKASSIPSLTLSP